MDKILAFVIVSVGVVVLWFICVLLCWLFWLPIVYFGAYLMHNAFGTNILTWQQCRAIAFIVAMVLSTLNTAKSSSEKK